MFQKHTISFMVEGNVKEKKWEKLGAKDKYDTVTMITFLEYGFNLASRISKPAVDTSLQDLLEKLKKKLSESIDKNKIQGETIIELENKLSDSYK